MTSLQHPHQHQSPQRPHSQNENANNVQNGNGLRNGQNVQAAHALMNQQGDPKQIICSFHRDFIPEMDDLYKYFGQFGQITNKLEIEYDTKKVPLAKIRYESALCVNKVCGQGNRQQIPSGAQNGTIHIRVYRSVKDFLNGTTRQNNNRSPNNNHRQYNNNKHKNNNNNNHNGNGGQRGGNGHNNARGRGF